MRADIDLRKNLFQSIVVSGGTAMFPGLSTRLANEISDRVLKRILDGDTKRLEEYNIDVEDPPNRRFLVFLGGTVLANMTDKYEKSWAMASDYAAIGAEGILNQWQSAGK